jgi:hypothetical protein
MSWPRVTKSSWERRGHDKVSRGHDLVTSGHDIVSRSHDLTISS